MKIVKRLLIFLLCIGMAGGILFLISIPSVNDHIAKQTMTELAQVPMPEQTKCIEKVSAAGKLSGNGNGMQYFGAILIRSDLSLEELDAYYSGYRSNEWECLVETQEGQSIEVIDHETLQFSEEIKDSGYYILYSWGSGNSLLEELDIRGH